MGYRKNFILVFIIIISLISPSNIYARSKKSLELSLIFDKSEYTKKDDIVLNFSLKNTGKKDVYVNKRFFLNSKEASNENREVYLIVESPSGEKLPYKGSSEAGLPRTDDLVLLAPGKEVKLSREKNIKHLFDFNESGEYRITAVYQNVYGKEIGINAVKNKIVSKPVVIKITE